MNESVKWFIIGSGRGLSAASTKLLPNPIPPSCQMDLWNQSLPKCVHITHELLLLCGDKRQLSLNRVSHGITNDSFKRTRWLRWHFVTHCGHSDAIWHCRSSSTMVLVMVRCLTAPNLYRNQYLFIVNEILWHQLQGDVYMFTQDIGPQVVFKISAFGITAISPKGSELRW